MDFRHAIHDQYDNEFKGRMFRNDQEPRLSGQSYSGDPKRSVLTFEEFLDSFFGDDRLNCTFYPLQDDCQFELEHMGNVLFDNVIK